MPFFSVKYQQRPGPFHIVPAWQWEKDSVVNFVISSFFSPNLPNPADDHTLEACLSFISERQIVSCFCVCAKCLIEYQRRRWTPTQHNISKFHSGLGSTSGFILPCFVFSQRNQLINALFKLELWWLLGLRRSTWATCCPLHAEGSSETPAGVQLKKQSSWFIDVLLWNCRGKRKIHLCATIQALLYHIKRARWKRIMNCYILWEAWIIL